MFELKIFEFSTDLDQAKPFDSDDEKVTHHDSSM